MDYRKFPARPENVNAAEAWVRDAIGRRLSKRAARRAAELARVMVASATAAAPPDSEIRLTLDHLPDGARIEVRSAIGDPAKRDNGRLSALADEFASHATDGRHVAEASLYERDREWLSRPSSQ